VVSWTVSDLALAQSSGSALPPQLLQYEFAAPEVLDAYRSNFTDFTASHAAHDVWALGALLFTLYFRRCLFDDQESAMAESAVAAAPLVGTVSTSVSALPSKLKSSKQTLVNKHYKYSARRPSMWRHVENAKLVDLLDKLLVDAPHRITIDEVLFIICQYFFKLKKSHA
jgi:serine/threonine protein kinase